MSLYSRVHTPNSPLLPLSPIPSSSTFLSPQITAQARRRSFTPNRLNILPPPSVSPIGQVKSSPNMSRIDLQTPKTKFSMCPMESSHQSRRSFTPNHLNFLPPSSASPIGPTKISPNVSRIDLQTPQIAFSMYETPQRYTNAAGAAHEMSANNSSAAAAAATAATSMQYDYLTPFGSTNLNVSHNNTTPSLLEETFTVMSILKEINMQKYAHLFVSEEVDLFVFLMLTYEDMIELGIEESDRAILMGAIHCFTEFFGNPENNFL